MPTPVQEAQYRRDEARGRTRRLSWLIGGGAATASVALGAIFSQLLPGHSAAASTGAPASAGTGGAGASQPATAPTPASSKPRARHHHKARSQPAAPPAPVQAPPVVVSGGS